MPRAAAEALKVVSVMQGAVLETGGGSIEVERCAGQLKATTGGGSIELGDIGGPVEMETGGGSIRLASAKGAVRAETGGGSIELNGVPSARAETGGRRNCGQIRPFRQRTHGLPAGNFRRRYHRLLASNLNITIRASIEWPTATDPLRFFRDPSQSEGGRVGTRKTITAEGSLNGGGPVLKVRTTTGNISFVRASRVGSDQDEF